MDTSDTKPGFTKLKLFNILHKYPRHMNQCIEIVKGETYISSKLFRENNLPDGMIIHGPCHSAQDETYDLARSFRCREWITPAHQWIFRSRSLWQDHRLVMSVVKKGVLFVPIGCFGSMNEDLEWRISFSMAEKQLIFSFSNTQLLCYALMKIILKDIIKKKHGDLICSYFLKTILFWLFEESSPSEWNPGNMISCFTNCLRRLIYCVEYKTCLHYFIPKNNLFEGRFTDYQHKFLLDTLHAIYHSLWTYVFHTATFQCFREAQRISSPLYFTASSLSCFLYAKLATRFKQSTNRKLLINRIININDKEFTTYMMSLFSSNWMQSPDGYDFTERNKYQYKQYQISLHCFKAGLYANTISVWSLLASLFYKNKRFNECIYIINYTLSKYTPDKIMLRWENSLSDQTYFQKVKEAVGLLLTFKHLIINSVWFTEPYYLLPVELTPLIQRAGFRNICIIPSVVYLNMLSFLCLHHLEDHRGKLNALRDLQLTIRKRYFILSNKLNVQVANNCFQIAKSTM